MSNRIDFKIGHWRHRNKESELIAVNGEIITSSSVRKRPILSMGVGDTFARDHPELFIGCGCKKDVIAVMNRWAAESTTEARIENVASTIANKNKDVGFDHVLELIGRHLQSIIDEVGQ